MFGVGGVIGGLTGSKKRRLKGSVVLMRKSVLGFDVTSISDTVMDNIGEFVGHGVTCQLISSTVADPCTCRELVILFLSVAFLVVLHCETD